jgi:hypothetical protein
MAINNAKHIVSEINGVRCTIVETGVTLDRVAFLTDLLGFNNLEVKELQEVSETPGEEQKYTIGVTDLMFNPVFAVYEKQLKTREGSFVTPGYWKQECIECDPRYWIRRKTVK